MKFRLSYILLLLVASSCARNPNHQLSDANHIVVDSLSGYSINVYSASIQVHRAQRLVCSAVIFSADSQYLQMAKQLDSLDTARGFIFARALEGPELAEPAGCDLKYSIDSTYEYHNKFNVRCFFIRLKGIQTCDDGQTYTLHCQGYFVDISQGQEYKLIETPADLGDSHNKEEGGVSEMLANNINFQP